DVTPPDDSGDDDVTPPDDSGDDDVTPPDDSGDDDVTRPMIAAMMTTRPQMTLLLPSATASPSIKAKTP
ncbi:BigA, partial [Salmonella enterica subsp. enterica serovar Newport str. SHSN002]